MRKSPSIALIVLYLAMLTASLRRSGWRLPSRLAPRFRWNADHDVAKFGRFFSSAPPNAVSSPTVDYFSPAVTAPGLGFGDYQLIASQGQDAKVFTPLSQLGTESGPAIGSRVWIRGRVTSIRLKGNACFAVIRDGPYHTVQVCHFKSKSNPNDSKALLQFMGELALESIVDVCGTVASASVKTCSQNNVELYVEKMFVVSRAPTVLPFLLEDAARSDEEIASSHNSDRPLSGVAADTRLNARWLDLRVPANNAILRLRSAILLLFREFLLQENFIEINTPKIIAGESEGGAEVFRTDYFGTPACLAQSPQLYKQMAISSDLGRVFEVGPVFRAEKSMTRRHLCEFTGLDLEMAIQSHYHETLIVLHQLFRHIFEGLENRFAKDLHVVRQQYPSQPVQFTSDPLVLHWPDAIRLLREAGHAVREEDDLTTAMELVLGELVRNRFQTDFYIVDQYPSALRPFYTMPNAADPRYSNSYDLFLRGQEICSGAQRCHDVDMLQQRIRAQGLNPTLMQSYVDSFKHGISPHAGAGIGLDRVVFLYLGLDNVRKASMFPRDPHRCTP